MKGLKTMEMEQKEKVFLNAQEVAELLSVKQSRAYKIIRDLNKKLSESGKLTIAGRINRKYLLKVLDVESV